MTLASRLSAAARRVGLRQRDKRRVKTGFGSFNEQVRVGIGGKHLLGLAFLGLENARRATPAGQKACAVLVGKKG